MPLQPLLNTFSGVIHKQELFPNLVTLYYLKGVFCGSMSALYLISARPPLGNPSWLTGNCEMKSGGGPWKLSSLSWKA